MAKSTVIKSSEPGEAVSLSSVFSLTDIARQVEQVIAAAQVRGDHILAEARGRAKRTTDAAHREGYIAGFTEGRAAGEKEGREQALAEGKQQFAEQSGAAAEALKAALTELEKNKLRVIADATGDLLVLAQAVAEKITKLRVTLDSDAACANLEAAIRYVAGRSNLVILVNPADLEATETFAADLVRQIDELETIDVQDDAAVSRGGCIVKHGVGRIDATVETQLDLIARQLLGVENERVAKPADGVRGVSSETQQ